MTKAITAEGDQMQYSASWTLARRGILKVYDDRLECGDWTIPYTEIDGAVLASIRSTFFTPGYVLRIDTKEKTYHFGLNGGRFWKSELPFPVSRERGSLGYSKFSIIVRLICVAFVAYWLWQRFS